MNQRGGPGLKISPPTWLQATENPLFPDGVYQGRRVITGTRRRRKTFCPIPEVTVPRGNVSFSNKYFLKGLINFGTL